MTVAAALIIAVLSALALADEGHLDFGIDPKYLSAVDDVTNWHVRPPFNDNVLVTAVPLVFRKGQTVHFGIEVVDLQLNNTMESKHLSVNLYCTIVKKFKDFSVTLINDTVGQINSRQYNMSEPLMLELSSTGIVDANGVQIMDGTDMLEWSTYHFMVVELVWDAAVRNLGVIFPKEHVIHTCPAEQPSVEAHKATDPEDLPHEEDKPKPFVDTIGFIGVMVAVGIVGAAIIAGICYLVYYKMRPKFYKPNITPPEESVTLYSPKNQDNSNNNNNNVTNNESRDVFTDGPGNQESTAGGTTYDTTKNTSRHPHTVRYSTKDPPTEYINLMNGKKLEESTNPTNTSRKTPLRNTPTQRKVNRNEDNYVTAKDMLGTARAAKSRHQLDPTQPSENANTPLKTAAEPEDKVSFGSKKPVDHNSNRLTAKSATAVETTPVSS